MDIVATVKRSIILPLVVVLYGCSSGGSGGGQGENQVTITEVETGNAALLIAQPELEWSVCDISVLLECATLLVPLDYSNPQGDTTNVEMARVRADPTTRSRTLLMNPGGPGASGINFLTALRRVGDISIPLQDTFNFVSFDPRGIGLSASLDCDLTELFLQEIYAGSREKIAFNFDKTTNFAQGCVQDEGEYVNQLGSYNVVRDMNEMRKALGIMQIDFLGYSYGTRLAALYMQTYPESTGRFVLDGSMAPEPAVETLARGSLQPAQANIDALAQACLGITVICNPSDFAVDLQSRVDELSAEPASSEMFLLFAVLQVAAVNPGFEQLLIGRLAEYLKTDDVAELEVLDALLGLSESAEDTDTINRATFAAVMCADDFTRPTVDSLEALLPSFNATSDLLAEAFMATAALCAGWPASIDPIPPIATNQAPVSLVIGGPTDAQTPLVFAQQMAAAVGGQFLRSEHAGHTTVFTGKNRCTEAVVEAFLLNGTLPTASVCSAARSATAFDWQDEFSGMRAF